MIQAARSGKQNIAEGSLASAISKETEIKLTGIARASLEELLIDYEDFLRTHNMPIWPKDHRFVSRIREINRKAKNSSYETFKNVIEHESAEISANAMIALIRICTFLLDQQIRALECAFVKEEGGGVEGWDGMGWDERDEREKH